jgi:hypothetical protein
MAAYTSSHFHAASDNAFTRRDLLKAAIPAGMAAACLPQFATIAWGDDAGKNAAVVKTEEKIMPVRIITHGPKHHWFGYYDKQLFDPTGRYV